MRHIVRSGHVRHGLRDLLQHTYTRQRIIIDASEDAERDAYNNPPTTTVEETGVCLYDEQGRFQMAGFIFGVQRAVVGQPALILEFCDEMKTGDIITSIKTRHGHEIMTEPTIIGVVDDVAPNGDLLWRMARLLRHEVVD